MDFTNHTHLPAKILTGSTGETEMIGIIASKATYALDEGRLVEVPQDQQWEVFDKPFDFDGVALGPDLDFRRRAVDVHVFGSARAPQGEAVSRVRVAVECGQVRQEVEVFGRRYWEKSGNELRPTAPEPYVEMPLTNDLCFGGSAAYDGAEMTHGVNPDGCGFYMQADDAEGKPLPCLERPDELIQHWQDQPRPACFRKPAGMLGLEPTPGDDPENLFPAIFESMFQQAVPELVAPLEALGETMRLIGFSPAGDIVFPMPPGEGPIASVRVGELQSNVPSRLTSLVILADVPALIATYCCLFRYLFRPEELRQAGLAWEEDLSPARIGSHETS